MRGNEWRIVKLSVGRKKECQVGEAVEDSMVEGRRGKKWQVEKGVEDSRIEGRWRIVGRGKVWQRFGVLVAIEK